MECARKKQEGPTYTPSECKKATSGTAHVSQRTGKKGCCAIKDALPTLTAQHRRVPHDDFPSKKARSQQRLWMNFFPMPMCMVIRSLADLHCDGRGAFGIRSLTVTRVEMRSKQTMISIELVY